MRVRDQRHGALATVARTQRTWTRGRLLAASGTGILRFALSAPAYFVMVPLLVTWLGAEGYGVWVLTTTITGWLLFSDLGLRTLIIRQAAMATSTSDRSELERTVRLSATMYVAVVSLVLLLAVTCLGWVVREVLAVPPALAADATCMLGFGVLAFCVDLVGLGLFRGVSDGMGFVSSNNLVAVAYTWIRASLILVVAFMTRDVVAMAAASLVASVAGLLAWRATAYRAARGLRYGLMIPRRDDLGMLIGFSGLVQINDAIAAATPQLVEAFVVRRFGLSALGMFDVGVQLYTHARSVSFVAWFPVMPWLSSRVGRRRETRDVAVSLAGIAAFVAVLAIGVATALAPVFRFWLPQATASEAATIMTLMCAGFVIGSAAPLVYSWNALATPGKTTLLLASFAAAWTVPIVAGFTDSASEVGAWGLGAAGVGVVVGYLLYARGVTQRGSTHLAGVMLLLISAVAIGMGAVESRALWVSRALAAAAVVLLWFLARDVFSGEDT